MSAVVIPSTPARIAVSTTARMRPTSLLFGARADSPSTSSRACVSLKYVPKLMLIPCRSSVPKYSAIPLASTGVPPSPAIAVVTPIMSLFSASGLRSRTDPD